MSSLKCIFVVNKYLDVKNSYIKTVNNLNFLLFKNFFNNWVREREFDYMILFLRVGLIAKQLRLL